jgi:hypothetical protein
MPSTFFEPLQSLPLRKLLAPERLPDDQQSWGA